MEKNSQTKSVFTISGRHRFVACVILVILVSCATFAYLSCCYKQAQNDIVALQRKDAWVFEQVLNGSKNVKSKSSDNIDQLQALLDKHQERQEALLYLEYNKLQADISYPVTIGNNMVIAAGSVITHDIPNNCLGVGTCKGNQNV